MQEVLRQAKTDGSSRSEEKSSFSPPTLNLPKGGGAIRGIGEKFSANPVTGTGSMTVPIFTSPGRSNFSPQLSLSYDSGSGNGPFGLGWHLSTPSITRKTDKGLPKYGDLEESDVFILSGAEDLVPVLKDDTGQWIPDEAEPDGYTVKRYRPRIEGLFARIERWTDKATGEIHWRSISKDNITTLYGEDNLSRIFDPAELDKADPSNLEKAHPKRIFSWLICASYDDKGNAIVYDYVAENGDGTKLSLANEKNRERSANRYLKRIKYGNRSPNRDANWQATAPAKFSDWMFELIFDYGEGHYAEAQPDVENRIFARAQIEPPPPSQWPVRSDPFSSYRSGFEIRTYRLCRRILMFHHFPAELGIDDYLVRSTEFTYSENSVLSFVSSIVQSGYVNQPIPGEPNRYLKESLPPLEFTYTSVPTAQELAEAPVKTIDLESLENLPYGLDGRAYQWIDLDGDGIAGILTEQADTWFYKRNISPTNFVETETGPKMAAKFAPAQIVASKPGLSLLDGHAQFMDLSGGGQPDAVTFEAPTPGFYERSDDAGWESFRPFHSFPNLDTHDPNVKFLDLDGDGHADILISEDDVFHWYPSLAENGFGTSQSVRKSFDEEAGPALVFADGTQSIYLADLSGDGLTDIVRIRNGEVCYWPNIGYGRFGKKVTMDNAPWFDASDMFDQGRIRLADIDGSGTTDILYLHTNGIRIYFNQSGNSWSTVCTLNTFPATNNLAAIQALDLLGNGTACLVWSSPLPSDAKRQMRYIDLMNGQKPHLLVKTVNNLGAETLIAYAPSTKFYLQDKEEGKPWITKLPFPVHVVERIETIDRISRNIFVSNHAYHHGYFDKAEREFRGFGRVEQYDTEEYAVLSGNDTLPDATNIEEASHVPPVKTVTWFHTGAFIEGKKISRYFEDEYFREPVLDSADEKKLLLDDTIPPTDVPLNADELREAARALKGSILRQEIYANDGSDKEKFPYTVSERNYTIKVLQPRNSANPHASFFVHPFETIDYHYERNRSDPRVQHTLTLQVDNFGNVLKSIAIGYGRRDPICVVDKDGNVNQILNPGLKRLDQIDQAKQTKILITYTESNFTNPVDDTLKKPDGTVKYPDDYRTPLPSEVLTYELTGFKPGDKAIRFNSDDWTKNNFGILIAVEEIAYTESPDLAKQQKRLIEHVRTLYRKNDLTGACKLGELDSQALPFESFKLAFTNSLANTIFIDKNSNPNRPSEADLLNILANEAGYVHSEGDTNWWIPSGKVFYSRKPDDIPAEELPEAHAHFFLPRRFEDAFRQNTFLDYANDLLLAGTEDALQNKVAAQNDFRVLQPVEIVEPNDNHTQVAFDALGLVVGTSVKGKVTGASNSESGDTFDKFAVDLTPKDVDTFLDDPIGSASAYLQSATTRVIYDLNRFSKTRQDNPGTPEKWEPVFAAVIARENHINDPPIDGIGKYQVSFSYSDGFGREIQKKVQAEPGPLVDGGPIVTPRWVGTGWTIFNNKGKPVRQYEPFFSTLPDHHHQFEFARIEGVSPTIFYDPLERVIVTLHPNHTYEKVLFDPWKQTTHDVNDTVTLDPSTDEDVKGFFLYPDKTLRLAENEYKPTWYALRTDPANAGEANKRWPDPQDRNAENEAALKAADHADTPTVAQFDSLGRTFLTITDNGNDDNGKPQKYPTRVELDIESNQRSVTDALDRLVMSYDYDMLSTRVHQNSMDAGEQWTLNNVVGKPIYRWDSRGFRLQTSYDFLHRPIALDVLTIDKTEFLAEKTVYGEDQPNGPKNPELTNHRTKIYQVYDGAGIVTNLGVNAASGKNEGYDFKGNLLRSNRQLLAGDKYKSLVDWNQNQIMDETFSAYTRFDALNRVIQQVAPHVDKAGTNINVIQHVYNAANLLERIDAWLQQAAEPANLLASPTTTFHPVTNIDYNAKGQRVIIEYGNGARTDYTYDPETFRLSILRTDKNVPLGGENPGNLQNLHYVYDPVGNITRIRDDAQKTVIWDGNQVDSLAMYTYDALYRLTIAQGREHAGQNANFPLDHSDFIPITVPDPNDPTVMRSFTENYTYDQVGNIRQMAHHAKNNEWVRVYGYDADTALHPNPNNPDKLTSNRLIKTTPPGRSEGAATDYTYDEHGNMKKMPHLSVMEWDFKNQLQATQQQVVNGGGIGEKTYYVYDNAGQRLRKVTETIAGQIKDERVYLGGFEIYRKPGANTLIRETLHVMDDKQRIAMVESRNNVDDGSPPQLIRYQFGNHLGSSCLDLNDNGAVISYEEYFPYGSTSYQAVDQNIKAVAKRYRYSGKEKDEESGLYYYGLRYYASWLARWSSPDPIGIKNRTCAYIYVSDNPINLRDPMGLDDVPIQMEELRITSELSNKPSIAKEQLANRAFTVSEEYRREGKDQHANAYQGIYHQLHDESKNAHMNNWAKVIVGYYIITASTAAAGVAGGGAAQSVGFGVVGQSSFSGLASGLAMEGSQHLVGKSEGYNRNLSGEQFSVKTYLKSGVSGALFGMVFGLAAKALQPKVPTLAETSVEFNAKAPPDPAVPNGPNLPGQGGEVNQVSTPQQQSDTIRPVGQTLESVADIIENPQLLRGKNPAEVERIIGETPGWKVETLGKGAHKGEGWILREYTPQGDPTGRMIRWHPGGGHHGPDPYWRVTGGSYGKSSVIR